MRWILAICLITVFLVGALVAIIVYSYSPVKSAIQPASAELAAPRSVISPKPSETPARQIHAYSDLIRMLPGFADAEFFEQRLPLEQVARIIIPFHAYVCPRQELWITHPDAPELEQVNDEGSRNVHLTHEQVVFVHWVYVGKQVRPIHVFRDDQGAYRIFNRAVSKKAEKLARFDYQWNRALSVEDLLVVPCDQGVAIIKADRELKQDYRQLSSIEDGWIQVALTPSGFIAWAPATSVESPDTKVACYSKDKWRDDLSDAVWKGPFVHLIPFTDGSVLQIRPAGAAKVSLSIVSLDDLPADKARVKELVKLLSDDDAETREQSHAELAAMGPSAWSLLETILPAQLGEAQLRIQEIIQSRNAPALGRFKIIGNQLQPVWRLNDGAVFLAESGVQTGTEEPITPAWICVRRGMPISLLPPALSRALAVGTGDIYATSSDWIVSDTAEGAKLFFGQEFLPLNKKNDIGYRKLSGIDRLGRILLAPYESPKHPTQYLLIDPGIADPIPSIQIWEMIVPSGEVGWDAGNWPAVKRQAAYTLRGDHWESMKEGPVKEMPTEPAPDPQEKARKVAAGKGFDVWVAPDAIELRQPNKPAIRQPIPAGVSTITLAGVIQKDRLYLAHPQGRISQFALLPQLPQPFKLQATFTNDVPDFASVLRMWVDPAGRVCIATDDGRLIILFVDRKIPPAILDMIPAGELKQARPAQ